MDNTYDLPDVTDSGVPTYTWDIAQNEMAILASVAGLAGPVNGTESSADFVLAPDSIMNLGSVFDSTIARLLDIIPNDSVQITAASPRDWTNLVVESLNGLFTAS